MKFFSSMILVLLLLVSCGSDDANEPGGVGENTLACQPTEIAAEAAGGTYTLDVSCTGGEWTAYASDNCAAWITTSVTGGTTAQGTVDITVKANTTGSARQGSVVLKSGAERLTVPIEQAAPMSLSATAFYSLSTGESFTLEVMAADDWTLTANDDWIEADKSGETTATLTIHPNETLAMRRGTVTITCGREQQQVEITQESAEDTEVRAPEGYTLVWSDEFNQGETLNANDWTHEVQGPGWVNNELQTYVDGQAGGRRVTELVDGKLNIHCFKGTNGTIYSGRVYAHVNEGWLHGYFEARILLPKGKGTWPAFWMMPVNNDFGTNPWPNCGEIDIMEEVGADANIVSSSIHCKAYNHTIGTQKTQSRNIGTAESEFHIYACEWTEDYLRFFVDGEELMTFENEGTGRDVWPFTYAFYPILNLAWGGDWGGYAGVDESALPVTMKVDYLRVFQKVE